MQMVLRPVAVRALLLVAGVILGIVALLTVFAATTSASSSHGLGDTGSTVTARGVMWN